MCGGAAAGGLNEGEGGSAGALARSGQPGAGGRGGPRPLGAHRSLLCAPASHAPYCLPGCLALLPRLCWLLLPLGLPALCAPPRLICDSRVLERYILEAREAENATVRPPLPRQHPRVSREEVSLQESRFLAGLPLRV